MKIKKIILCALSGISILWSCKTTQQNTVQEPKADRPALILFAPGPQAIVYKTTQDYSSYIPVTMDNLRKRIVSYPAPSDIYYKGALAVPTPLSDGYWLDNRGINENTVFLNYTYEEYSKLAETPDLEVMKQKIIDYYPFSEIWNCGLRSQYKDEKKQLDSVISSGFSGCKRIK